MRDLKAVGAESGSERLQRPPRPARPPGAPGRGPGGGRQATGSSLRESGTPGLRKLSVPRRSPRLRCKLCKAASREADPSAPPLRCPKRRPGPRGLASDPAGALRPPSRRRRGAERPARPAPRAPHLGGHGGRFPGPAGPAGLPRRGASFGPRRVARTAAAGSYGPARRRGGSVSALL